MYFIRLLADGEKLRKGLLKRRSAFGGEVREAEEPLIKLGCAMWTAPHFSPAGAAGGGYETEFYSLDIEQGGADEESGRMLWSGIENPRVALSKTAAPTNGGRQAS